MRLLVYSYLQIKSNSELGIQQKAILIPNILSKCHFSIQGWFSPCAKHLNKMTHSQSPNCAWPQSETEIWGHFPNWDKLGAMLLLFFFLHFSINSTQQLIHSTFTQPDHSAVSALEKGLAAPIIILVRLWLVCISLNQSQSFQAKPRIQQWRTHNVMSGGTCFSLEPRLETCSYLEFLQHLTLC